MKVGDEPPCNRTRVLSPVRSQRYSGRLLTRFRISQVLEELTIRLEQHDVATIGKRLLIRVQTASEGVKFRIAIKGVSIDSCGSGITITPNNFRISYQLPPQ